MAEVNVFLTGHGFRIEPDTPELRRALEAVCGWLGSEVTQLALARRGWSREGVVGLDYPNPDDGTNTVPEGHLEYWYRFPRRAPDRVHFPEGGYLAVLAAYLRANGRPAEAGQVDQLRRMLPPPPTHALSPAAWWTGNDVGAMIRSLDGKTRARKWRLFSCACCRRLGPRLTDWRLDDAFDAAERLVAGTLNEPAHARRLAGRTREEINPDVWRAVWHAGAADAAEALELTRTVIELVGGLNDDHVRAAEEKAQADLLREVIGNPFRPVTLAPAIVNTAITSLAQAAYEEGVLPSGELDRDRLAILADALEEAGCTDQAILDHLRSPGHHVRGCWVADLILARIQRSEQPDPSAAQGALLVRLYWPRCMFWGGEWNGPYRDALWVECAAEAARKLIHPLLDKAAVERSEEFADDLTNGEPTQDGQPALRYCFLISTDLRLIDPHPVCYPWSGMWNTMNPSPFREIGEHRVNSLEELAGTLPRRPWWRFWG
jgi:hypothetical protein